MLTSFDKTSRPAEQTYKLLKTWRL